MNGPVVFAGNLDGVLRQSGGENGVSEPVEDCPAHGEDGLLSSHHEDRLGTLPGSRVVRRGGAGRLGFLVINIGSCSVAGAVRHTR